MGVVSDRYKEDLPIWDKSVIGGPPGGETSRSRCEYCGTKLRWFELIPILSFFLQKGRCLTCGRKLSFRYPLIEIATGLVFVFVPVGLKNIYLVEPIPYTSSFIWILVFSFIFLASLIDFRLRIIPDEIVVALTILGIFATAIQPFSATEGSFLGNYGLIFGIRGNVWLNHFSAALIAAIFFALIILVTKGKGMGGGDVKLAAAMGLIFGWPDILLIVILSFVIGSLFGIAAIALKREKLKSLVPFGPFLFVSSILVFFFGNEILRFYFGLFGL